MSSRGDPTVPPSRRTRKSLGSQSPQRKAAEKENATVDIGSAMAAGRKKSRSKSIGPGGLDVLKPGNGNRRVSLAAPSRPPPRSILKPTTSLLPEIPPHKPRGSRTSNDTSDNATGSSAAATDSSGSVTKIALRTEEEQQAAAREREEREREAAEKEIQDRREARRKSLANRRVSFAAEATLHTFHEIEYMQDTTTSTDDSPRRASSVASRSSAAAGSRHHPGSDDTEVPDTPPAQAKEQQRRRRRSSGIPPLNFNNPEDETLSSTIYSSDSEQADEVEEIQGEELSGSDSDVDVEDGTVMTVEAEEMTSASMASVASARSMSEASDSTSLDQNLRLAVQRAATQQLDPDDEEEIPAFAGWLHKPAATTPTSQSAAPAPQANRSRQSPVREEDEGTQTDVDMDMDLDTDMDMEMTSAVGRIIKPDVDSPQRDEQQENEVSMDLTHALGGILTHAKAPSPSRRKSRAAEKHPSPSAAAAEEEEEEAGEQENEEEATMEFTTAVGGIRQPRYSVGSQADADGNEDMSMELTTAIGAVLTTNNQEKKRAPPTTNRRQTISDPSDVDGDDADMDMTVAVGRIIQPPGAEEEEDKDDTVGMDMTMPLGGIIKSSSSSSSSQTRSAAKKVMEEEANTPDTPAGTSKRVSPARKSAADLAEQPVSPSVAAFRGKGLHRTPVRAAEPSTPVGSKGAGAAATATPKSTPRLPSQKNSTPTRPKPAHSTSTPPSRTPQPKTIGSRSSSPERQTTPKRPTTPQSASAKAKSRESNSLFRQDPSTGTATPRVVLTPQGRRLSGVGADRSGLGSPRVTELFDRRDSIGNSAETFVSRLSAGEPKGKGVSFADPRVLEGEVERERQEQEEEERQRRRRSLDRRGAGGGAPDERDATLQLKEMIQGLSPRKNPLKGRKSLHVGSARGLLGKRPAELDDDGEDEDDFEEQDGVKRLKGHQGSPVKNVKLQSPPSKAETTGRRTRAAAARSQGPDGSAASPTTTTPRAEGRQRHDHRASQTSSEDRAHADENGGGGRAGGGEGGDEQRIHLQDFLNMTSIRFMELTTTKRRHTVAPTTPKDGGGSDGAKGGISLEDCVVAGACTVPMLELYQHSCRELKKYISEGRRIVREIETETFEENPPLFREYMTASPEFKVVMDNQFKNVKTHARLLSKAMWYEWRMKLQDGLREGLERIAEGMDADEAALARQEALLAEVLPGLAERVERLGREREELEAFAREMAECDPADLEAARLELIAANAETEQKSAQIEALREELRLSEESIAAMRAQKQACLEDIAASERIREECRGWSTTEILALRAKVDALEHRHGWAITGIAGTTLSMAYRREIEIVFDMASFQPGQPNATIDLWYIAGRRGGSRSNHDDDDDLQRATTDFFLQCIRDKLRGLSQQQTKPARMLSMVRASWDRATTVAKQVRLLNVVFPTTVTRTSDSSVAVRSSLLLEPVATRVEVVLHLHGGGVSSPDDDENDDDENSCGGAVEVAIVPQASVVYGEHFKAGKMAEFLAARIGSRVVGAEEAKRKGIKKAESWCDVVVDLHGKLLSRGKR